MAFSLDKFMDGRSKKAVIENGFLDDYYKNDNDIDEGVDEE